MKGRKGKKLNERKEEKRKGKILNERKGGRRIKERERD